MNACYAYLLLLTLAHRLQHISSSFQLPNITVQHVCENEVLFLQCLKSNETLQIIRSMYGRTSQRICNNDPTFRFFDKTCANIEQSKHQTKLRCHGKSTCQILINNDLFTDPCGLKIPKHFEIHYRCIDRDQLCPTLFVNCSKLKDIQCIEKVQDEFACSCPPTICQYTKNRLSGFIEHSCPAEDLHQLQWTKSSLNRTEYLPCPYPCTGQVFRRCSSDRQWSPPNYTHCECPMSPSDLLSTHRSATSYVFQCNFWLIKKILPADNSCILSFTKWRDKDDASLNCLWSAFKQMTEVSCLRARPFGIDFQNLAFEIYRSWGNESRIHLPTDRFQSIRSSNDTQLIVERTDSIKILPKTLMLIDTKINHSIILIEQEEHRKSMQTANVTVIFNHQSSELRYQCRAYRPGDVASHLDSSDVFFACQLLCSNGTHVICQCPFFNPLMHYTLQIDTSTADDDFKFLMMENDLRGRCSQDQRHTIDRYINDMSPWQDNQHRAKKLLSLLDLLVEQNSFQSNWNEIVEQIELIGFKLMHGSKRFLSVHRHLELSIQANQDEYENHDRSVFISTRKDPNQNIDFQLIVLTLSAGNLNQSVVSSIVNLNVIPNYTEYLSFLADIQITFRHQEFINESEQVPICVHLKTLDSQVQWSTDGCRLLATNATHSTCSCSHLTTFALRMETVKPQANSKISHLMSVAKISCAVSIVCLLLTLILLISIRHPRDTLDDLTVVRNIFHGNIFLCLLIVQFLFLFGIDQAQYKFACRITAILLDYFLLATFSWMFVDTFELSIAIKHTFKVDRIRLLAYSLYSYGFPLLIVFLAILLSTNSNDSISYCWSSYNSGFLWALMIPFLLLIFANVVFFILSLCQHLQTTNTVHQLRFSLRITSSISILFGLTWLIGLFYLSDRSLPREYLFAFFNMSHAVLVLVFFCLLQRHIRAFLQQCSFDQTYLYSKYHSFLSRSSKTNSNATQIHEKSIEHFSLPDNASSSGYSSAHSSDLFNKQIVCHPPIGSTADPLYLPSIPITMLSARLNTFRYPGNRPLPTSNELILVREQHEQLLEQHIRHDDDHQYYEIG